MAQKPAGTEKWLPACRVVPRAANRNKHDCRWQSYRYYAVTVTPMTEGVYATDIARLAGAGTLVPITGFANAITAPAVEFRTDESDIIGLSQKAFKHLDASMMI